MFGVTNRSANPSRAAAVLSAAGIAVLVLGAPAAAHVSLTSTDSTPGASVVASFSVGHGCGGSPTTALTIQIPDDLAVTPVRHPAWEISTTEEAAGAEGDDHGHGGGRLTTVTFTAEQALLDGIRDTVQLAFTLPEASGVDLVFPTVQTCEKGETAWTQVAASDQDPHDLESPAPLLTVTEAIADAESDEAGSSSSAWFAATVALVALVVSGIALGRTRRD